MRIQYCFTDYPGHSIKRAAEYNQLHICQFLLNATGGAIWPDYSAVLENALGRYAFMNRGPSLEAYRLFMEAPGFDLQVDSFDQGHFHEWLVRYRDPATLNFILQKIPREILSNSIQTRFEIAMQVGITSTAFGFLQCMGLPASDPRLALLRTSFSGRKVLHCIVRHLAHPGCTEQEADNWVRLGVAVLRNGADPCVVAKSQIYHGYVYEEARNPSPKREVTPLLERVGILDRSSPLHRSRWWLRTTLKALRIWAGMVQQAGIDLCQYGAQEREVRATLLPKAQSSCWFAGCVPELIYGSTPEQWSLQVPMTGEIRIFEFSTLPGSFPSERKYLPTTILWTPTSEEMTEGPWIAKESLRVGFQSVDMRDLIPVIEEDMGLDTGCQDMFREHVNGFQDDNGPVCMMQYRAARERRTRRRSHSQPPPICRRAEEGQYGPVWLPRYHQCPYDSKWGLGVAMNECLIMSQTLV